MGLDASQARLLTLTARQNNLEYRAQCISQARMMLTSTLETEATLWSNGMNTNHLYYCPGGSGSAGEDLPRLSYSTVTGSSEDGGLGLTIRDSYGRTVVPELPNPIPEGKTVADYAIEPYCFQADYFETNLKTGNWFMQTIGEDGKPKDLSIDGSNFVYQGIDASDYAIANAEYETKVERLHNLDKQYEMELSAIEAERTAVMTEKEDCVKIIEQNIKESFKTFG